jgi:nuclear pore complex protein Nup62
VTYKWKGILFLCVWMCVFMFVWMFVCLFYFCVWMLTSLVFMCVYVCLCLFVCLFYFCVWMLTSLKLLVLLANNVWLNSDAFNSKCHLFSLFCWNKFFLEIPHFIGCVCNQHRTRQKCWDLKVLQWMPINGITVNGIIRLMGSNLTRFTSPKLLLLYAYSSFAYWNHSVNRIIG